MKDGSSDKNFEGMLESIARGIMVGGSLGAIAGWLFMDFQRALGLGMLVGCLAGITMRNIKKKKE